VSKKSDHSNSIYGSSKRLERVDSNADENRDVLGKKNSMTIGRGTSAIKSKVWLIKHNKTIYFKFTCK
jgi:hypothetical protein